MKAVKVLILTGYGLNCDAETAYSFEKAGASTQRVHINRLIAGEVGLNDFQILVFGGGFSWGDDHGAGVVQAVRMRTHMGDQLVSFIEKGNLVIGICNGFQTLVNLGLLPGLDGDYTARKVALIHNDCGNFRDDWVTLRINSKSPCVFTREMALLDVPVRHGEGKFYAEMAVLSRLKENNQIVVQYALPDGALAAGRFPYNPNGAVMDIAGICDPTGRVFGLMPHPEAFNHPTNHPDWLRYREKATRGLKPPTAGFTPGIQLLKNAVDYFK
ncbi:MAG: phosphoribosylformylglycinamidine synthase subunit PurQ [Desulfobacterales bacterium]|jgi:phosphoribosylformylglycinamidine synthase|nr:phosphoribosylformylglycinamidine synthase subunit PurQ [Desulfobacterales bacterium]